MDIPMPLSELLSFNKEGARKLFVKDTVRSYGPLTVTRQRAYVERFDESASMDKYTGTRLLKEFHLVRLKPIERKGWSLFGSALRWAPWQTASEAEQPPVYHLYYQGNSHADGPVTVLQAIDLAYAQIRN